MDQIISPEGILISGVVYTGIGLTSGVKYICKKRGSKIRALILGAESGKSTIVKIFNELYTDEKYYFLDLEGMFDNDAKTPSIIKDELLRLKRVDCILYTARVIKFLKVLLTDIWPTLKRLDKTVILVLSNRNLAKFLGIKQRIYLTSDRKLYKNQFDKSENQMYLSYCRSSMKAQKTTLYKDYDDLLQKIQEIFDITDKL